MVFGFLVTLTYIPSAKQRTYRKQLYSRKKHNIRFKRVNA